MNVNNFKQQKMNKPSPRNAVKIDIKMIVRVSANITKPHRKKRQQGREL